MGRSGLLNSDRLHMNEYLSRFQSRYIDEAALRQHRVMELMMIMMITMMLIFRFQRIIVSNRSVSVVIFRRLGASVIMFRHLGVNVIV